MTRHMVLHLPLPLNPDASAASGIRPMRMRDAFRDLGYEVWEVTGYSADRRRAMARVEEAIKAGTTFDFCYSESSTMPMTMTDRHHLPLRPMLDRGFFRRLRKAGTPVGHFLRDIFWRFPEYRAAVRFPKREAALAAYQWDLATLRRDVDRVFLPSLPMADYLDLGRTPVSALPPAHDYAPPVDGPTTGVRLFYVGGIGAHYRLEGLFDGVARAAADGVDVTLTVCTTPQLWALEQPHYARFESPAITVAHAHGPALLPHFEAANVGALYVEPDDYWKFAVPVKQFEYLGAGKPILAAAGSLTGDFVESNGVGWSVDYDPAALAETLRAMAADPGLIAERRERVLAVRDEHTWRHRAGQVAAELTGR